MKKVLLAVLMTATIAYGSDPGTVKGTMTVGGKKTDLRYAVAKNTQNGFDKKVTDVVVLLSNIPVTAEQFSSIAKMMDLADSGKLTGIEVEITPDNKIISGQVYSPEFHLMGNSFSAVGMHQFDAKTNTKDEVEGKLSTTHESSFKNVSYTYNATFHALVTAPKPEAAPVLKGTKLPAGGGDPGKAYLAFAKSLTAGDQAAVINGTSAERAKQMKTDPDFKKFFPMIQAMEPKNIKVTGGAVDGDNATLIATGSSDGQAANGTITMVREGGKWKVAKESWKSGN